MAEQITLGPGGVAVAPLGVGTRAWGERRFWNYGQGFGQAEIAAAFEASVAAGITFFDTAEFYGSGESERLLGGFLRASAVPVVVGTKFAPWPWRQGKRVVRRAITGSLRRLGVGRIDLYQVHFPYTVLSQRRLLDALADAVANGEVGAVGVSNYSARQFLRARDLLAHRGVPLAANQVQYSLFSRRPERDGTLDACRAAGATLIAYSPLAQGLVTGKYRPGGTRPRDFRRYTAPFGEGNLRAVAPVVDLLRAIGREHGGKTPEQVALNWLIAQGDVLPIPGAKDGRQATANAGALGWSLSAEERVAIDAATRRWR
jgi:aryl-alcohol dehydrogenase-like predicted oxidoreductase